MAYVKYTTYEKFLDRYSCDNSGNVYTRAGNGQGKTKNKLPLKRMKGSLDTSGYVSYTMRVGDKQYSILGHRFVWFCFNGKLPSAMVVNHINGNKIDNRIENLELLSPGDNQKHAIEIGLRHPHKGSDIGTSKLTEEDIVKIRKDSRRQTQIAKDYGVTQACISAIKCRKTWSHV